MTTTQTDDRNLFGVLQRLLNQARSRLIQTDGRNRLINTPRNAKRSKSLSIVSGNADEIFRTLLRQRSSIAFASVPETNPNGFNQITQRVLGKGPHEKVVLQTQLTTEGLQKRLLGLFRDARTLEEEQGVNVLYLAIGFLRWYEDESSEIVHEAPLILLPVSLVRNNTRSSFRLTIRDDDIVTNLPLQERLQQQFGITLPIISDSEDWDPTEYFLSVGQAISTQSRWSIDENGMMLGFFSFSKFLMFRDLGADTWPNNSILSHSILSGLLVDGFPYEEPLYSDDVHLDRVFTPADLIHVVDADASQTLAIETVRKGRNLVIQGPPGTGKSQTITNIIAAAVHDGKRVLFVAEKMAALNVVHQRLVSAGLGDLCLELHSRQANKREVVKEIERTLRAVQKGSDTGGEIDKLKTARDYLNANATKLHNPLQPSGVTPFRALGQQVKLAAEGHTIPKLKIANATNWTETKTRTLVSDIQRLAEITAKAGPKYEHAWRGMNALTLQPADQLRLADQLKLFLDSANLFSKAVFEIGSAIGFSTDCSINQVEVLSRLLREISLRPSVSKSLLVAVAKVSDLERLSRVVTYGNKFVEVCNRLDNAFLATAWKLNFDPIREGIVTGVNSWLSRCRRKYKQASKDLSAVYSKKLPKLAQDRLQLVDSFLLARDLRMRIEAENDFCKVILEDDWIGLNTNFITLEQGILWIRKIVETDAASSLILCAAFPGNAEKLSTLIDKVSQDFQSAMTELMQTLDLDVNAAFSVGDYKNIPIQTLTHRGQEWINKLDYFEEWAQLARADRIVREEGGEAVADALATANLKPERAVGEFLYSRAEALWKMAISRDPSLAKMDGDERSRIVAEFCTLEKMRRIVVANDIQRRHQSTLPRGGIGEMAILRGEIAKQRGHLPIRRLVQRTAKSLLAIKPVFLMSPISVAQFLAPGAVEFDLLVIDEASQVRPEDALGVIARVKQIVVVGDKMQLPPTSFFDRMVDDEDDEGDDEEESDRSPLDGAARATQLESILSACEARGMPNRMLTWHYRSRHPSLIEVSNDEFYENRLFLFPSPQITRDDIGLVLHKVTGSYDRGGKKTNEVEARAVVESVARHVRKNPNLSLGVVTFSISQRNLIDDLLELKRREDAELDAYMQKTDREQMFVKNLENVQGDERDAIIISVGYGPRIAGSGLDSMQFGPISNEGGERRLNVLFTRARVRCEVIVSFSSGDIDLERTTKEGPRVLKRFLKYAETGKLDLPYATGGDADSPFEESVAKYIEQLGYLADAQVGSAGFKIDLAVKNPKRPGEYILAVECDGATYHSARWARERDRLRQEVLEGLGWKFYRIWSTDWFRTPERAKARLAEGIKTAELRSA
jgi:hypothetical protein